MEFKKFTEKENFYTIDNKWNTHKIINKIRYI